MTTYTTTRRSVLAAAAGAGAALSLGQFGPGARAQTTLTRYEATSPQGKQMLGKYAKAVRMMKNDIPTTDARNWQFQWFAHWIPGPQWDWSQVLAIKAQKIEQVYAGRPLSDPQRVLAQAMWDTCQVHSADPSDPNLFQLQFMLPWHRLFLYYFEQIVRGVLELAGEDHDFSLPYWNYLGDDVTKLSIPPEFRDPNSPLYVDDRIPEVNAGQRLDWSNIGELNDDAFQQTVYDGPTGFCGLLNWNPHHQVHSLVGLDSNMSTVPNSAKDPIFWLHHCQIDRLWESWNRLPNRSNPLWPQRSFVFADAAGNAIGRECLEADRVALLGYEYDSYHVPKGIAPVTAMVVPPRTAQSTRAAATAPVQLAATLVQVALRPSPAVVPPLGTMAPEAVKAAVFALKPGRRLYLVLGDISLRAAADTRFNIYLELPAGATPSGPRDPHYVGTLNFFGVEPRASHTGHEHHTPTFDVTRTVETLARRDLLTATPTVSLVPVGTLNPAARPVVGRITLVEA